jgi:hypothetical protein
LPQQQQKVRSNHILAVGCGERVMVMGVPVGDAEHVGDVLAARASKCVSKAKTLVAKPRSNNLPVLVLAFERRI